MHALQTIRETGSLPMTKAPTPTESKDDRDTGKVFAQEVLGLMISQAAGWKPVVQKLFGMTVEARTVAVEQIGKWKSIKVEELMDTHKMDERAAKKFLNSAGTRMSQITKIAKAINGGMTEETLSVYWKCSDPLELSIDAIYKCAVEFLGADARGRKPDTLLVKLGKWIEVQKKNPDPNAEDRRVMDELLSVYNRLAG